MQKKLSAWLLTRGYGSPITQESIPGGCINTVTRLRFRDKPSLILKQNARAPQHMFHAEATGLSALAQSNTLRVPEVLNVDAEFLLLEDLGQAQPHKQYWQELGTGLAALHANTQNRFGFTIPNYCGATAQPNTPTPDGWNFFAHCRLLHLADQAQQRLLLNQAEHRAICDIANNLRRWIPNMPAVLIHGDLWSGNVHCDDNGRPSLIDPACYWGWAEAELAMTLLFGGFPQTFYDTYKEAGILEPDWRERAPLYNLYHLLNHLLLFGKSYSGQINQVCMKFAQQ